MSINAHIEELRRKHQNLEQQVEAAQKAPSVDDSTIASLKKEKLRIKEEIHRLSQ